VIILRRHGVKDWNIPPLAFIAGSAINQDGRSGGLTAPSKSAQVAVIQAALRSANLKPNDIQFVEAHGTGTQLGDPIELSALRQVFAPRPSDSPLWIGSVKTNIGHLEAAAAVAGVIKMILAMNKGQIPSHLHLHNLNPHLEDHLSAIPASIPTQLEPWPKTSFATQFPRRAGVSSFGVSGTNAHIVLELPKPSESSAASVPKLEAQTPLPLVFSAKSAQSLQNQVFQFHRWLNSNSTSLSNTSEAELLRQIATTLSRRSMLLPFRHVLQAYSLPDVLEDLAEPLGNVPACPSVPSLAFLFTGQGSQFVAMGKQLYFASTVFRKYLDNLIRQFDNLNQTAPNPVRQGKSFLDIFLGNVRIQ